VGGKREGKGTLTFKGGASFIGSFEAGRPLSPGQFKWSDGTKDNYKLEDRFEPFLGRGSEERFWLITLFKMMAFQKEKLDGGDDEDTAFGFGDMDMEKELEDEPEEPLADGEVWVEEEVEVDEFGNPIEETARIVSDVQAVLSPQKSDDDTTFAF
jgi:hypothetical protein